MDEYDPELQLILKEIGRERRKNEELRLSESYLNMKQARAYLGDSTRSLSLSEFKEFVKDWDIPAAKVPGARIVYREIDLKRGNEAMTEAAIKMLIENKYVLAPDQKK
jgi:hypothetical protein